MTKIVYNSCYGGFSLSKTAILRYAELKGITLYQRVDDRFKGLGDHFSSWYLDEAYTKHWSDRDINRTDPVLVKVVEELGTAANGRFAELCIADVPVGTRYRIDEYDGNESVMTVEDYEWSIA
jgi:pyridoxal/pyridoxine/pyridoxamine kinase